MAFEIYAASAAFLLPTGIVALAFLVCNKWKHDKLSQRRPSWIQPTEAIATILMGIFYMYSAIVLSLENHSVIVMEDNNEMAIVNNTIEMEIPTFFTKFELITQPTQDEINEIEDTRNNKRDDFLENYQKLVQTILATRKISANARQSRNSKEERYGNKTDKNCFQQLFFYHALLIYSFINSAISLFNTCQNCDETQKTMQPPQHQPFGEEIKKSKPTGRLFDQDSLGSRSISPNLEIFSVKNRSIQASTTSIDCPVEKRQNSNVRYIGCVITLCLPVIMTLIIYFIIKNGAADINSTGQLDFFDFIPNFSGITPNKEMTNFVKNPTKNYSQEEPEVEIILRNVYGIIDKIKEPKNVAQFTQYNAIFHQQQEQTVNSTCTLISSDNIYLKTYDLLILVILFFTITLYTKLSHSRVANIDSEHAQLVNKRFWIFLVTWMPNVTDFLVSTLIMRKEPTFLSHLFLLFTDIDRIYSNAMNVKIYKNMFVEPTVGLDSKVV